MSPVNLNSGISEGTDGYQSRKKVDNMTKIGRIWSPLCIVVTRKKCPKYGQVPT